MYFNPCRIMLQSFLHEDLWGHDKNPDLTKTQDGTVKTVFNSRMKQKMNIMHKHHVWNDSRVCFLVPRWTHMKVEDEEGREGGEDEVA